MKKLHDPLHDVPGGWFYCVPETGERIKGNTLNDLEEKVRFHLDINELDVPDDLRDIIENEICLRLPKAFVKGSS